MSGLSASPSIAAVIDEFAEQIRLLNEDRGLTPVIVTPRYLSLKAPFFVALATSLTASLSRSIRFDWYRDGLGIRERMAAPFAQRRLNRVNRALSKACAADDGQLIRTVADDRGTRSPRPQPLLTAEMVITSTIARPGGEQRPFVVGLCNEHCRLPSWTAAIQLSGCQAVAHRSD